ncbi:MAG: hypothetical protein HYV14_00155 [Elusimicrobia bacterium]|nr:hypothetical protein [Elusimicrobiota bacterium]
MNEKKIWSAATLIGGGLDGLMILAALDRIEGKLAAIQEKMVTREEFHSRMDGFAGLSRRACGARS